MHKILLNQKNHLQKNHHHQKSHRHHHHITITSMSHLITKLYTIIILVKSLKVMMNQRMKYTTVK